MPNRTTGRGIHIAKSAGYNTAPDIGTPRRPAIAQPTEPRSKISRLRRIRTWALPITIITATAAQYLPGHTITEILNRFLPEPTANIIDTAAQWVNAADPTYLAVAIAASSYWFARERIDHAVTELIVMVYKNIFKRARQEVIAEAHDKGHSEGHTEGRNEMLQELKAKAPPDVKAWLERAGEQTRES